MNKKRYDSIPKRKEIKERYRTPSINEFIPGFTYEYTNTCHSISWDTNTVEEWNVDKLGNQNLEIDTCDGGECPLEYTLKQIPCPVRVQDSFNSGKEEIYCKCGFSWLDTLDEDIVQCPYCYKKFTYTIDYERESGMKIFELEEVINEKAKYYTPSLEEFHIGFEYEYKTTTSIMSKHSHDWRKVVEDHDSIEERYWSELVCRVKYLTKEDIESLGFEFRGTESFMKQPPIPVNDYYMKGKVVLTANCNTEEIVIGKVKNGRYPQEIWHKESFLLFSGKIKNKSELKTLLKQLGI